MSEGLNRRNLLKRIGIAGGSVSALSGVSAGESDSDGGFDKEKLTKGKAIQHYRKALSTEPVKEMKSFLDEKDAKVEFKSITGSRVTQPSGREFVAIQAGLSGLGEYAQLTVHAFEKTATATAIIGGDAYKSNPDIVRSGKYSTQEDSPDVMPVKEWYEQTETKDQGVSIQSRDCEYGGTFDVGGPACDFISGISVLAGSVFAVIPEPGSTIIGTALISGVLAGSCTASEAIDDILGGCNFTKIGICVQSSCRPDPIYGYWCEYKAFSYPVGGC